ncbi:hypothetical protein L7F22_041438 [Adiantum nelumboides]|nr:hypothetical protein [Adiantum nelumboides]
MIWYFDSGASRHITSRKDLFSSLDAAPAGKKVTCANNASYPIKGVGKILITISDGSDLCLPDVLYVPGIKKNLLSVSSLAKNGLRVIFEDDRCIIRDRENGYSLITTGTLENGLFVLDRYEKQIQACIAETKTQAMQDAELWHARFGHVGYGSLMTLQRHNMVHDLSLLEMPPRHVCEGCVLGKMHRFAFSHDGSVRATRKLQLVHSDVCGPMRTPSVGNSLYFVTFIDDFSRFCWVYPLKAKSDVFVVFQHYVSMVENETGCKVQTLRTDRGGEYMSGAFKDFLGKKGIKHQCTMPYTPQQNGVAERKNRSLMEMARCMLKAKSLPHKLWMEAVACAAHVLNRCPTRALKTITPYESWYDRKPSVSYLRVFGCLAYAHIPQQLRGKLDDKAVKCIFVGYIKPMVAFDVPHMQTQDVFEGFLPSFVENQESQQVDNFDQSFDQHVTPHDVEEIVREEQEVLREERTLPKWVQKTLQDSKLDAPLPRKTPAIQTYASSILADEGLTEVFAPNSTLLGEGDLCVWTSLAKSLASVAEEGPAAFYNGSLGQNFVNDVQDAGGILSMDDLARYTVKIRDPTVVNVQGLSVFGMPPPSSAGACIAMVLNILAAYPDPFQAVQGSLGLHRMVEAIKHAFAIRMNLSDPDFVDVTEVISTMLNVTYAAEIQSLINDNRTYPSAYYGGSWSQLNDHGTCHFNIVDGDRNVVSMTSTVNYSFGAKMISKSTGIVMNNEMDDFSIPTNSSGSTPPAAANFIQPYKRPLSSMAPTIVMQLLCLILQNGQFLGVLGGSGGTKIITATLQVFLNSFWKGYQPLDAVSSPRLHHQLFPDLLQYEQSTTAIGDLIEEPLTVVKYLESKGHIMTAKKGGMAELIMQDLSSLLTARGVHNGRIMREVEPVLGLLTAVSDPRKDGSPCAY